MNSRVSLLSVLSLGKIGFSWKDDIDSSLQGKLLDRAVAVLPSGDSVDLSSVLNGLFRMKYDWKNDGKIEKAICDGIIANYHPTEKSHDNHGERQLADIAYYLGRLSNEREGSSKITLKKEVFNSIWNGIEKFAEKFIPQGTNNLIYGYE
jgi:hypothetical protein